MTSSPFTDSFLYIPDLPFGIAKAVLPALNGAGAAEKRSEEGLMVQEEDRELYAKGEVAVRYNRWLKAMAEAEGAIERRAAQNLTLGYVTTDVSSYPLHSEYSNNTLNTYIAIITVLPGRRR